MPCPLEIPCKKKTPYRVIAALGCQEVHFHGMLRLTMSWGEKKKQKHRKLIDRVGGGEGNRFNIGWPVGVWVS